MRFKVVTTIDAPIDEVWAALDDPGNLPLWQTNVQTVRSTEGQLFQLGSKGEITVERRGHVVHLAVTVTERVEGRLLAGTYETKGVVNEISNRFTDAKGQVQWEIEMAFRLGGWRSLLSPFLKRPLIAHARHDADRFREMVEEGRAALA